MPLQIRQETADDFNAVYEINTLAFGQDNEAKLVNALRTSTVFVPALSLVAAIDNNIVGHILFTKITILHNNHTATDSLALAPMAVHPAFQQQGIGSQLIKTGLQLAKDLNYPSVIVLGHEHYYPKFGFQPAAHWDIRAPFQVPSAAFMAIELTKDALINAAGTVKYPLEFNTV